MNEEKETPLLVAVAMTIADGLPVDWDSLLAEHPDLEGDLKTLRVLQDVEAAGRESGPARDR